MKIIGITGVARAGKDTIGDCLCRDHKFARLEFARPLKRMVSALLQRDFDWVNEHKEEHIEGLASPRVLLQTLGTDWGRNMIDSNIWVNAVHRQVNDFLRSEESRDYDGIVLTDCRFDNEAEWVRGNGGEVWQVERNLITEEVPTHPSENGVRGDLVDRILANNATILELNERVGRALRGQGGRRP